MVGVPRSASSTLALSGTTVPRRHAPSRGDHHFGFGVVDALAQRLGGKSAEDDAVRRADLGAGEHGDGQLRHHAHVDRDAVALGHAQRAQRVGEAIHLALEHAVGQHARIARLAFPDDGRLVAPRRMRVPVHAVVGDVQLAADEPLHPRRVPLQHLLPRREPVQALGLARPRSLRGSFRRARRLRDRWRWPGAGIPRTAEIRGAHRAVRTDSFRRSQTDGTSWWNRCLIRGRAGRGTRQAGCATSRGCQLSERATFAGARPAPCAGWLQPTLRKSGEGWGTPSGTVAELRHAN